VDGNIWPQDRRLLTAQKQPVLTSSETPEVDIDLLAPRSQTYDSLTTLRHTIRSLFQRIVEQIHAIEVLKEGLIGEEEGVRRPRSHLDPTAFRRCVPGLRS
jgi:hypothetical protein